MPDKDNTFSAIGVLVVASQTAETLLNQVLTFVIQDGIPLTYDRIVHLEQKHRKRTLGFFVTEIQKRVTLDSSVAEFLEGFLVKRNTLVHRFDEIPGHELRNDDERQMVRRFLGDLATDMDKVLRFSTALLHAWTEEAGIADKVPLKKYETAETMEFFSDVRELSSRMKELVGPKA